jgi:hypothetical protein
MPAVLGDFVHPSSEDEIRDEIRAAAGAGRRLRVIGSGHSEPGAIAPEGCRLLMLDRMRTLSITPIGDGDALAEAEAGINLGRNPYDPTHSSTWANSLNCHLRRLGFALPDLGGISHQTVGGFLATGSSGGSVHSVGDAIERVRFIDGLGDVHEVARDAGDPEERAMFDAVCVSMGLLGVVTKVTLRAGPDFNIAGQEAVRPTSATPIDFFGDQQRAIAFDRYLREVPYSRLMWWPQLGFDRMVVWQAQRMRPTPGFTSKPYQELGGLGRVASLAGSLVYTIVGNLSDLTQVNAKLADWYRELDDVVEGDPDPNACPDAPRTLQKVSVDEVLAFIKRGLVRATPSDDATRSLSSLLAGAERHSQGVFSDLFVELIKLIISVGLNNEVAKQIGRYLETLLPSVIDSVLGLFVTDDGAAGPQIFQDSWMCGLPMDNQMDDRMWPTVFTELWVPLDRAREVMIALRDFYRGGGDEQTAFDHTGAFSCEIYAAKKSPFWLSPSFGRDSLRIDVFWFGKNAGSPMDAFYPRFWELLEPFGFRPHWGKALPKPSSHYHAYYRRELPHLEDFLQLRQKLDPSGVFATPYWREHLGF